MSSNNALRSVPLRPSGLHLLWQAWLTWLDVSAWPGLILVVIALGLLAAFHQVTSGIVKQSELRMQNVSVHNKATWLCNSLNDRPARENCLLQRQLMESEISARLP